MKIAIDKASATQLALFANINHGLDVSHREGVNKIREKLEAVGFTGEEIEIEDPDPAKAPKTAAVPPAPSGKRKMVTINIPKQAGPGGARPVPVGVNGRVALIQRAKNVDVPEEYVHALENAKTIQFDKDDDGRPINPQLVPKHPYSVVRPAH